MPARDARSASPKPDTGAGTTSSAVSRVGAPYLRLASLKSPPLSGAAPSVRAVLASDSGSTLPMPVRGKLEASFGVELGAVRVHQSAEAAALVDGMKARAFAIGSHVFLGSRQNAHDLGLMAHEVAHVIQQQHAAAVQRKGDDTAVGSLEREADSAAATAAAGGAVTIAGRTAVRPLFGFGDWVASKAAAVVDFVGDVASAALDFIRDKAKHIPGYPMLAFVLGRDPITRDPVERTPVNLIRGFMSLWPGGNFIFEALQKHGIIDRVGNWLSEQIDTLKAIVGGIRTSLDAFIRTLGVRDIARLGDVFDRAKRIFTEPLQRVRSFVTGLATAVVEFIRDAILMPLAKLASGLPHYDLLKAVLGRDPVTGEPYPRNADTLIGGFMRLIGQEEVYQNMKKANAVARAWAWFQKAMQQLVAFVQQIPALFIRAFKSLGVADLILVPRALMKVGAVFAGFVGRFISWAGNAVWNLLEIIFDAVSPGAFGYIRKTGAALRGILRNPIPFVRNLVRAAMLGFQTFAGNIGAHLKAALIEWLTGSLPGVYIPKSFALPEIVKFVFSVLGLTWANIRGKLVKVIGETAVKVLETTFDVVVTLVREGPGAAWDKIKEQLANLKDMVIGGIIDFVVDMVVKKAVPKIVAMFIPGAGFISAIISIYDTIMVFVQKISKIIQVVKSFVDSIVAIAGGAIAAAAKRVESTLAGLLTLAISFLAGFAGLGKVADRLMGVINKVRAPIDKALDALIKWIVTAAKTLLGKVKAGAKSLLEWWRKKVAFSAEGESHTVQFDGSRNNAKLRVHTDPKSVPEFVRDFVSVKGTAAQIKDAEAYDRRITALQVQLAAADAAKDAAKVDKLSKDLDKELAGLTTVLTALLKAGGEEGGQDNPVMLDYPKRRATSYPPIYVGPRVGESVRVAQNSLKKVAGSAPATAKQTLGEAEPHIKKTSGYKNWDGAVRTFVPTAGVTSLDGKNVGLSPEFASLGPGKLLVYGEKGSTGGGGKINDCFRAYGFSPSAEGLDGDHVMERQIGGPDELANLWPLPKSENRSSGSTVKSLMVEFRKKKVTVHEARALRKKGPLHLLLRSVKG